MSFFCYLCSVLVNQMFNFNFSDFMKCKKDSLRPVNDFLKDFFYSKMGISLNEICYERHSTRNSEEDHLLIKVYFESYFYIIPSILSEIKWLSTVYIGFDSSKDMLEVCFKYDKNVNKSSWK